MYLDVNYKLIDRVDVSGLEVFVEKNLKPFFNSPHCNAWKTIAERCRWIGVPNRPADIAYRKMRPTGYMQMCFINDEEPYSPWAIPLPSGLTDISELTRLLEPMTVLCSKYYGEGILYFCVFAILAPQGNIPPHKDMPHDVNKKKYSHHLHIPLTQADETEFTVGNETFRMEMGGVYEINNMIVHSVVNRGDDYRVNLMLDYCSADNLSKRNNPSPTVNDAGHSQIRGNYVV